MAKKTVEAEPEVDETVINDDPSIDLDPDGAPPEAPAEPEVEPEAQAPESEPAEAVDENEAPGILQRYNPMLAEVWGVLPPEQREAALERLYAELDSEPEAPSGSQEGQAGQEPATAPRPEGQAPPQKAPVELPAYMQPPQPIAQAEWDSFEEQYGDDPLFPVLKAVMEQSQWAANTTTRIGTQALGAIDETVGKVVTLREERAFRDAVEAHGDELDDLDRKNQNLVVIEAQKLFAARKGDPLDAVALALYRHRSGRLTPQAKTPAENKDQRRILASGTRGSKRPGQRAADIQPIPTSYRDAARLAGEI